MENMLESFNSYDLPGNMMYPFASTDTPAISIIIPLYNAEKYIGEALESILTQTFQSFEVIVVDDCSTDASCEVVESYIPKFSGRLNLQHMPKNSGSAPAPRNKGFLISRGEYIFFMDSDDVFTQTALEEMYNLAKGYDADVVYCENYFMSEGIGQEFIDNIHIADSRVQSGGFVDKPTLISDDLTERLEEYMEKKFWVTPWQRLVSRKLLFENKITFPEIIGSDDVLWCLAVLCFSKKFLRVPNLCYIRRMYEESFTQSSQKSPNRHIHQWLDLTIRGLQFVNDFMDRLEFFHDNPEYRYKIFKNLALRHSFNVIYPLCKELPISDIYDIFLNEFAKDNGEHNVLISFLCTRIFDYDKDLRNHQQRLKKANNDIQSSKKRIAKLEGDIKRLKDENGHLKKEKANSVATSAPTPVILPLAQSYSVSKEQSKLEAELERLASENARLKKELLNLKANASRLPLDQNDSMEIPSSFQFAQPAISVVIPMYNAEEYITECLDSLLIQTFQDFEVIVADDCSTDKSVEIVNSYAPKFNGRLRLTSTKENSGGGGYIPRNLGLKLANGEYVIFLDADDFLLGTALETLYTTAEKYEVEVVYSSTYYNVVEPNDVYLYRDGLGKKLFKEGIEDKLTLTVDDRDKMFQEFLVSSEGNFRNPWSKFVRRDFLLKNEIRFPDIMTGGDCIWCINVYAYAKRFLRLPTPTYFYRRYNSTSLTRTKRASSEQLSYWVSAFIAFLKALNELQNKTEFLREHPFYCYEATRGGHFEWCLNRTNEAREGMSNKDVYEILYRELSKENYLFEAAVPFFFSVIDNEKKVRKDHLKTISNLKKEINQLKK